MLLNARQFLRDQCGSVLVEMTLIVPLFVLISAGVFEFGNLIQQRLLIEAGLRDAARYGARCNEQLYADYDEDAIDCEANAVNIFLYGIVNPGGSTPLRVPAWESNEDNEVDVEIADVANCFDAVVGGTLLYRSVTPQVCIVRATSTFEYDGVGMLAFLGIGPITLSGVQEERYIRF